MCALPLLPASTRLINFVNSIYSPSQKVISEYLLFLPAVALFLSLPSPLLPANGRARPEAAIDHFVLVFHFSSLSLSPHSLSPDSEPK